jgi:hypothetical protein
MLRKRATVSPQRSKRLRRSPSRTSNRKVALARSMKGPATHTFIRTANINIDATTTGFDFAIGVVNSPDFSIWFTTQSVYLWNSAANYSVASIPGYTDLAALFDEVKIDAVEVTIMSGCDPTTSANGSAAIAICCDYNDKAAITLGDIQQYADCRTVLLANNHIHKEIVRPKFLEYSLDSAGSAQASISRTGFTKSNLDIEHYGIKGAMMLVPPNTQRVVFTFKYKYICRVSK